MKYDFLVAVIRDRPDATGLASWIFFTGASVMLLVGLIILCSRTFETEDDNRGELLE